MFKLFFKPMKLNQKKECKTFESALFLELKKHGLLSSIGNDSENEHSEMDSLLPKELDDPEKFILKRGKTVSLIPDYKSGKKSDLRYRKVASKAGPKKRKKK